MKLRRAFRWEQIVLAALFFASIHNAIAAAPVVSNVRAAQRAGTGMVDIYYDLASPSNALTVSVTISTNGGTAYFSPGASVSGTLGAGIAGAPDSSRYGNRSCCRSWAGRLRT